MRAVHSRWSSEIGVIVGLVRVVLWLGGRDRREVVVRRGDAGRIRNLVTILLCGIGRVEGGARRFSSSAVM